MDNFVVVGGSGGIGFAIVQRLIEQGNAVTVLSRTTGEISVAERLTHIECDVTKDDVPTDRLPDKIQGLVYAPGSLNLRPFRSLKPETFREDFEINVVGAVRCIQATLPALQAASPPASIVLFSTVAVGHGMPAHASIAAAKGAVEGLTRSLAAELSPQIRVNCVAPALTKTPLTARLFGNEQRAASLAEMYPLGRTGDVGDMASAACYLLGKESSWVTGQVIGVDGGMGAVHTPG